MTDDEFKGYRDGRYNQMLNYYDKKAIWNKRFYRLCSFYVLVVSAGISPIVLIYKEHAQVLAAILSPTVTLVAAIAGQYRFHDNWLRYRAAWDALKHEIHFHDAKLGLYMGQEDRHSFFVDQVEGLIAREGSEWLRSHMLKEKADVPGASTGG